MSSTETKTLYANPAATTSRAVLAFCAKEAIPLEISNVDLSTGAHHQAPFCELNPNRLVPVLDDGGFVLTEAAAILRYLARQCGSSLYPSEPRSRARVDELMSWFEANFYKDFGFQFVYPQLMPHHQRGSDLGNRDTIEWGRSKALSWLTVLDKHFLGEEKRYLVGDELTIADYFGAAILSLGELVQCDFDRFPNVKRWYQTVRSDEAWQSVHPPFEAFAESLRGQSFVELV